jgi:uncharacterized protein
LVECLTCNQEVTGSSPVAGSNFLLLIKNNIMSLQTQIREDMVNAMKNKETAKVLLLRVVIGEFGRIGKELNDEEALKVVKKMLENAKALGNVSEMEILDKYLPKMFSETQIRLAINHIIQENDYSGIQDMGKVMAELKSPSIDNKIASQITRELLTQ